MSYLWVERSEWNKLRAEVKEIRRLLLDLQKGQRQIMSNVHAALDDLEAQSAAIASADDAAEAAFVRLATMIEGLKNNQTDPATAQRIQDVADALRSRAAALGTAVAAAPQDTPAAPAV